jgi:hypothetical protein
MAQFSTHDTDVFRVAVSKRNGRVEAWQVYDFGDDPCHAKAVAAAIIGGLVEPAPGERDAFTPAEVFLPKMVEGVA